MDCQHLRRLLQQAKFKSLFRELSELDLSHDPDLSEQYTSLSARFNRYQRERHLMDTRDFETAQNRLIRDLSQFLDDLCEESEKATNSSPPSGCQNRTFRFD